MLEFFDTYCVYQINTETDTLHNSIKRLLSEIEAQTNRYKEDSEISRLNRKSGREALKLSKHLFKIIEASLKYCRLSEDQLDISIGPLLDLWRKSEKENILPDSGQIKKALQLVDFRKIKLYTGKQEVFLEQKGMSLDLGAAVKGYAADCTVALLKKNNVQWGLLDFGGNIYALGQKNNQRKWRIGLQDPFSARGKSLAYLDVSNRAVVSSGSYERFYTIKGKNYHHIFDVKSGFPVKNSLVAVSVISKSALEADLLSTLLFLMGLEKGMDFVMRDPDIHAVFISHDKQIHVSASLKEDFYLNDKTCLVDFFGDKLDER